jgi:hypothetical protein
MTTLEHVSYLAGLLAVGLIVWCALRRPARPPGDVISLQEEARKRGLRAANEVLR